MYDTSAPLMPLTMITTPLVTDSSYYPSSTVPTPPPSASSLDLPPIPSSHVLALDKCPLSPCLPAYLEPTPQANAVTHSIRPQLFHVLGPPLVSFPTRRATAPTLTPRSNLYSSLRRSHSQSTIDPYLDQKNKRKSCPLSLFQGRQEPCTSPTLTAACASANLPTSSPSSSTCSLGSSSTSTSPSSSPCMNHRIKDEKPMDQSMFLTKNAHIKRPRNAWIHFRCHYGQALKTQDPTLRAEEISKRASRRWSLLSENDKRPWHQMAEQEKQAHKEAFPEYRYCPKRVSHPLYPLDPTLTKKTKKTT